MTSPVPIRVLLVEDSPVALAVIQKTLKAAPGIEVVGTAKTGKAALTLIPELTPQVICTDFHMPHMDGLALTQAVMENYPTPILVLSVSVQTQNTERIFQLLEAGAVDILAKPISGLKAADTALNQALINKIRVLAGVKVFKKKAVLAHHTAQAATHQSISVPQQPPHTQPSAPTQAAALGAAASTPSSSSGAHLTKPKIIGIGASTGGPQALRILLSQLPKDCPPVICVQHISVGFLPGLVKWLRQDCAADISIAQAGDRPVPGRIYFSPNECHLTLNARGQFALLDTGPVDGHRPSITVTFESLAQYYGKRAVGVLLTGMGQDGAAGLSQIRQAGGMTIAQDEATSVVFGMPQVAIARGAATQVLSIEAIAPKLHQLVHPPAAMPSHVTAESWEAPS
ncbi:MAG: chemotaxis-specific protein-glutamate methyltransferase CheB [Phormidesmis sp.]